MVKEIYIKFLLIFVALLMLGSCRNFNGNIPLAENNFADILLFNGAGTSPNDVKALEALLNKNNLHYSTANSNELNGMNLSVLKNYKLLIFPGGNFIDMGKGLTTGTTINIRNAIHQGLNYFGICAGGFLAGDSPYYNSLKLTPGVRFGFYSAENKGIRKAMVVITTPRSPALEHYWEDGPQFTGWGQVIGKYPDGTSAIVQGTSGKGWIILSGIHAEAPSNWRNGINFNTTAEADNAYAATLINAALKRVRLPHY